ncbi:MAG TPA: HypC/HybG/HupF family hydrogenase formation chaperone [Solirubrobacteraceae bacterium]|jgi:hydrogenase assembly chaperone HypC/HupF|nr:HypC/HybG/HupF family hydrogenase formation chaperone [Solirubrobacteraceae bacterium]
MSNVFVDGGSDAAPAPEPVCNLDTGCITCGDVALPLNVLRLDDERGLALCADDDGRSETVEIDLVAPVAVGDRLLVHAGTAIAKLNEEAAG